MPVDGGITHRIELVIYLFALGECSGAAPAEPPPPTWPAATFITPTAPAPATAGPPAATQGAAPSLEVAAHLAMLVPNAGHRDVERALAVPIRIEDPAVRQEASARLVLIARAIESPSWRDQHAEELHAANAKAGFAPPPDMFGEKLHFFQAAALEHAFGWLGRIGGRPAYNHCLEIAQSATAPAEWRHAALDVLAIYGATDPALAQRLASVRASLPPRELE
jgi:hypothetical protein